MQSRPPPLQIGIETDTPVYVLKRGRIIDMPPNVKVAKTWTDITLVDKVENKSSQYRSMCGPIFCSMKITGELRNMARSEDEH